MLTSRVAQANRVTVERRPNGEMTASGVGAGSSAAISAAQMRGSESRAVGSNGEQARWRAGTGVQKRRVDAKRRRLPDDAHAGEKRCHTLKRCVERLRHRLFVVQPERLMR